MSTPAYAIDTPYWNDLLKDIGKPRRCLSASPVVLSDIGFAPVLQVSATSPALRVQIIDDKGRDVVARIDRHTPFRIGMTDATSLTLPIGTYTIKLTPADADLKDAGEPRTFLLVIAAKATVGAISGTLFNDDNANGVMDAGEKPTGIRTVRLSGSTGIRATTQSDAVGRYTFTGLPAGDYLVTREFPAGYRISNPGATMGCLAVTLAHGEQITDVNIGSMAMETDAEPPTDIPDTDEQPYIFGVCGATTVRPDLPVSSKLWEGTKPHAAVLAAIGCVGIREWDTTTGTPSIDDDSPVRWDRVQALVDAGVTRVLITLACGKWREVGAKLPTIEGTKASARAFVASIPPELKPLVSAQVGNEMFYENTTAEDYWPGTMAEFVALFLNPAYEVLSEAGIPVVLGGLNGGNPARDLRKIKDLGGKIDAVGWHPYAENVGAYITRRDALAAEAGAAPIIESESNSRDGPEHGKYLAWRAAGAKGKPQGRDAKAVAALQAAIDVERRKCPQITERYEFSLEQQTRTMTGPLGWYVIRREKDVAVSAVTSELFDVRFAHKFGKAQ
ncbi:MAG TPA: SdrD B-like domain-containing protein [Tepidisphaeraceae bacterium]|jgi:hypothetical protein